MILVDYKVLWLQESWSCFWLADGLNKNHPTKALASKALKQHKRFNLKPSKRSQHSGHTTQAENPWNSLVKSHAITSWICSYITTRLTCINARNNTNSNKLTARQHPRTSFFNPGPSGQVPFRLLHGTSLHDLSTNLPSLEATARRGAVDGLGWSGGSWPNWHPNQPGKERCMWHMVWH